MATPPIDNVLVPFPSSKLARPEDVDDDAVPLVIATCGSYNPIHTGHIAMFDEAQRALETGDGVMKAIGGPGRKVHVLGGYVSPVNDAYNKPGLAAFTPRLELCQLALGPHPWIDVDPWEGMQREYQRSYIVLAHILDETRAFYRGQGPKGEAIAERVQLVFLCGADLFETFYKPGCWELGLLSKIFSDFLLLAVCREGAADPRDRMQEAQPLTHHLSPGVTLDMKQYTDRVAVIQALDGKCASSTLVRKRLAEGESIEGLVPAACVPLLTSGRVYETSFSTSQNVAPPPATLPKA